MSTRTLNRFERVAYPPCEQWWDNEENVVNVQSSSENFVSCYGISTTVTPVKGAEVQPSQFSSYRR